MSNFDDDWDTRPKEEPEYFSAGDAVGHLLIVKVHDVAKYYRTENYPDGMVYPTQRSRRQFEPFPNQVVRCSIVDLTVEGADGERGKLYTEAVLFPSSLTKITKEWVGTRIKLVVFDKGPRQTDEFEIRNLATNERAVALANGYLARHPEFHDIAAPEPYDGRAPRDERDDRRDGRGQGRRDNFGGRSDAYDRDPWDTAPARSAPRREAGAQDWGQHGDRGEPRRERAQETRGSSFLEAVAQTNHHGDAQRDEDIPF